MRKYLLAAAIGLSIVTGFVLYGDDNKPRDIATIKLNNGMEVPAAPAAGAETLFTGNFEHLNDLINTGGLGGGSIANLTATGAQLNAAAALATSTHTDHKVPLGSNHTVSYLAGLIPPAGSGDGKDYSVFLTDSGTDNKASACIFIGYKTAPTYAGQGYPLNCIHMGYEAGVAMTDGDQNIFIGEVCASGMTAGDNNTLFGAGVATSGGTGDANLVLGYSAMPYLGSAAKSNNNVVLGAYAGSYWAQGSNNIIIGSYAAPSDETGNYKYIVGSYQHDRFMDGDMAAGTLTINAALTVKSVTTTQMLAIATPTEGMSVYNTTLHTLCFYDGTAWQHSTPVLTAITAGTTQTLAGATLVTGEICNVTVGNANDGVKLNPAIRRQLIVNTSPTLAMNVFPADASHQIDALGNGTAYSLAANTSHEFVISY